MRGASATGSGLQLLPLMAGLLLASMGSGQTITLGRARLIGPFDNLIFDRNRTRRVHNFDYTFEAYKPPHKRTYGHYVVAILSPDGRFLGRVDLRRDHDRLEAITTLAEPGIHTKALAAALAEALDTLAHQMRPHL